MIIENPHQLAIVPKRIISLVPSISALLHYLQLDQETIGITKFCTIPETWKQRKAIIGGTKNINIEKVRTLNPDLIICNREENLKPQIELLAADFPIWLTDVKNLEDNNQMISDIGKLTGKERESIMLIQQIKNSFLEDRNRPRKHRAAYLIWKEPFMTVGGDTFINDMMERAGFDNIFNYKSRYPVIELNDIINHECEILLLSDEPYPFNNDHLNELKKMLPNIDIHLVNGIFFSWYGSEILHSAEYFKEIYNKIHIN